VTAATRAVTSWREVRADGTRYAAQARDLATRPSAVVTADLDELRAALAGPDPRRSIPGAGELDSVR
jgi:hypothetical protein